MSVPKFSGARSIELPFAGHHERRRACRYLALEPDCLLRWRVDSRLVETPCRVMDISIVGCQVESPRVPAGVGREPIWFRPLVVSADDWTEGVIVGVRKPWFRNSRIRINFLAPFPDDVFRSLVFGPKHLRKVAERDAPEHERDHYWR